MLRIYNTDVKTDSFDTLKKIKKGCWIDLVNPNQEDINFLTDSLDVDTSFISYLLMMRNNLVLIMMMKIILR